jgi:hypothetical protein
LRKNKSLSRSSSSDDESFHKQRRIAEKLKKNIQNIPARYAKHDSKEVTLVSEFKLSKSVKNTIRDRRVKEMIE